MEDNLEKCHLLDESMESPAEGDCVRASRPASRRSLRWNLTSAAGIALLLMSMTGNVAQYWLWRTSTADGNGCPSPHAGVTSGVYRPFVTNTEWSSDNATYNDWLWDNLAPDTGMIAVSNDYSLSTWQYKTEPFPWDNTKGIYMLEGYHSLHCLMYIYRALREFDQGLPQTTPMHHHIHCLDALRDNAICHADDTLRPAGSGMATPKVPGKIPQKQCRDWGRLEAWAVEHSACFKRFPDGSKQRATLDEWRWCPEGSPYTETIDWFFGGAAQEQG